MAKAREPIGRKLRRLIKMDGECWAWSGPIYKDGYGACTIGRKSYRAHRVAYEHFNNTVIPHGLLVCHRCDNPACINPDHLFLGTPRDNTQDMLGKGRAIRLRDGDHPATKVRHRERFDIKRRRANGESLKSIASSYGVSFQTISAICLGRRNYGD